MSAAIIAGANPRANVAEVGPARQIHHANPATETSILAVAVTDFIQGIRVALGVAMFLLGAVLVAGFIWFPRGSGAAMADAQQEAKRVDEP